MVRKVAIFSTLVLLNFGIWSQLVGRDTKKLRAVALEVGYGRSLFVETPSGKRLLFDCGDKTRTYDYGERVIVPFLLKEQHAAIDYLFLSGCESDLIGGMPAVLEEIPVRHILSVPGTCDFIAGELLANGSYQEVKAPLEISFSEGVGLSVLLSEAGPSGHRHLAYLLEYREARFLFAGALTQEELCQVVSPELLESIDLVELRESVGAAMDSLQTRVLILSGGGFSYPRRSRQAQGGKRIELSLLEPAAQPAIFRSRLCGAVTLETDGEKLTVAPFLPGCVESMLFR